MGFKSGRIGFGIVMGIVAIIFILFHSVKWVQRWRFRRKLSVRAAERRRRLFARSQLVGQSRSRVALFERSFLGRGIHLRGNGL